MISFLNQIVNYVNKWGHRLTDHSHRIRHGVHSLERGKITDSLYLGGQYNLRGLKKLKDIGITAIINMRMNSIYKIAHFEGMEYLNLPTPDHTAPSLEDLIKGADFAERIIDQGGKVYVHCREGIGRGPTMVIAYLMKSGLSFKQAFNKVKTIRKFINPTYTQILRLKELEKYYSLAKS